MWTLINLVLGLAILVSGIAKRRRRSIWCGAGLLILAAADIFMMARTLGRGTPPPDVAVHAVVLLPVTLALAIAGARGLRDPQVRKL